MNQSAVGTTERIPSAVPTGLGFLHYAFPALKRWAKLFRPASGAPAWEPRTTFLFRPMMNNPKRWAILIPSRKRDLGVATSKVDVEIKVESGHYPLSTFPDGLGHVLAGFALIRAESSGIALEQPPQVALKYVPCCR